MEVGILSDIHSNLPALTAVLRHLGRMGPSSEEGCSCGGTPRPAALWCLGDTVGYNAHPVECLDLVRQHCKIVLKGNHDEAVVTADVQAFNPRAVAGVEHSQRALDKEAIDYLARLQPIDRTADRLLCHGSPEDPIWEYLGPSTAERFLHDPKIPRLLAVGHTHSVFVLKGDDRLVVNAGSVGQPRDGDPRASFVTVDTASNEATIHRVPYDIDGAARAVLEAGLPRILADRLRLGR